MKNIYRFVTFLFLIIVKNSKVLEILKGNSTDEKIKIDTKNFEDLGMEIQNNLRCEPDLLVSYGLTPKEEIPKISPHLYCPNIVYNCCGDDLDKLTMAKWLGYSQNRIMVYYETYLMSVKYLLGFSGQFHMLAKSLVENSLKAECKAVGEEFLSKNLNLDSSKKIYEQIEQSIKKMIELRKGFFCSLCDADFLTNINYTNHGKRSILLSKNFCEKLVMNNIEASFLRITYFKDYLTMISKLINCETKDPIKEDLNKNILNNPLSVELITKCFNNRNNSFFDSCEKYCEDFNFTAPSLNFDGSLSTLKNFVFALIPRRSEIFSSPESNYLLDDYGVVYMEDVLHENYKNISVDDFVFYLSADESLKDFSTDVLYYGGSDPYFNSENNKYPINFKSTLLLAVFLKTFLLYFLI